MNQAITPNIFYSTSSTHLSYWRNFFEKIIANAAQHVRVSHLCAFFKKFFLRFNLFSYWLKNNKFLKRKTRSVVLLIRRNYCDIKICKQKLFWGFIDRDLRMLMRCLMTWWIYGLTYWGSLIKCEYTRSSTKIYSILELSTRFLNFYPRFLRFCTRFLRICTRFLKLVIDFLK